MKSKEPSLLSKIKHQLWHEQNKCIIATIVTAGKQPGQLEADRSCDIAKVANVQVEVLWRCEEAKLEGSISMMRQKGPAPVYSAPWSTKVSCGPPKPQGTHVIMLQVLQLPVSLVRLLVILSLLSH